jgi:hypothetical protein
MLTTLGFFFLYDKIQLYFVWHAHNSPFTCGKGLLKNIKLWKYFEFLKF